MRSWWRSHRKKMSLESQEKVYLDLCEAAESKKGIFEFVEWDDVKPLEEAIDISNIPDFDELGRIEHSA